MHVATLWQIALAADTTFSAPVASIFTTLYLTTIPNISGLLVATDYIARANYYDNLGVESGFGPSLAFTTLAADDAQAPQPGIFQEATQGCGDC